jgi:hypothetical protein
VVEETRQSWCASYERLLSAITATKVLFWFASRGPRYTQGWSSLADLFGAFPQLVNPDMVNEVRTHCDHHVECVTDRGMPQILTDRFTGVRTTVSDPWMSKPWAKNWYYPSPEMHEDAAAALEPLCRTLVRADADI